MFPTSFLVWEFRFKPIAIQLPCRGVCIKTINIIYIKFNNEHIFDMLNLTVHIVTYFNLIFACGLVILVFWDMLYIYIF